MREGDMTEVYNRTGRDEEIFRNFDQETGREDINRRRGRKLESYIKIYLEDGDRMLL
jgi:hypothetical protein